MLCLWGFFKPCYKGTTLYMYDLFVYQTYSASFVICTPFIDYLVLYWLGTVLIWPNSSTLFHIHGHWCHCQSAGDVHHKNTGEYVTWVYWSFSAATKQLYDWFSPSVCLSIRPSVCQSHLFHHVPIIISSWNFQELLPWTEVMSMQKVKVGGHGQGHRGQHLT